MSGPNNLTFDRFPCWGGIHDLSVEGLLCEQHVGAQVSPFQTCSQFVKLSHHSAGNPNHGKLHTHFCKLGCGKIAVIFLWASQVVTKLHACVAWEACIAWEACTLDCSHLQQNSGAMRMPPQHCASARRCSLQHDFCKAKSKMPTQHSLIV